MEKGKYYTAGKFARKAGITLRALRYYDEVGLLKPSARAENGYRLYCEEDMVRLQRIIALRYLRFSIDEIKTEMEEQNGHSLMESLHRQKEIFAREQEHLQKVVRSIERLEEQESVSWNEMTHLIQLIQADSPVRHHFIETRSHDLTFKFDRKYGLRDEPWQGFMFRNINVRRGDSVLELDISSNVMWDEYADKLPYCHLTQTAMDKSILDKVKEKMEKAAWNEKPKLEYRVMMEKDFDLPSEKYDVVVCGHLFLRGLEMERMLKSCRRALKPGGTIYLTAIGFGHMKELFDLVKDFEPRVHFYNMDSVYYFGKERGREFLKPYFEQIEWYSYENEIMINDVESITEYVWNTYSNVQQVLEKRKEELKRYIAKVIAKQGCLRFKMEAGLFAAKKAVQKEEEDDHQA